jgi:hypothetical protein
LGEAWPTGRALCVPMHTRDIIGFKAGMSRPKLINYKGSPIISDFFGSATVPLSSEALAKEEVAPVGVPPTESFRRNRSTYWVNPQAYR